ncbi:MAG: hypothetical protein MJ120_05890, partial [Clostridia bacterium]|nr:hypothetical protein [Clostridia bacterium]
MINKILSFIASFIMLFQFMFPAVPAVKQSPDMLKEPQPQSNPLRTFDKIEGVSGSEFYIERPATELKEVKASQFGVDANKADNFNEIKKALEYCVNNPNTKLTFSEGTYYLDNKSQLLFKGMEN